MFAWLWLKLTRIHSRPWRYGALEVWLKLVSLEDSFSAGRRVEWKVRQKIVDADSSSAKYSQKQISMVLNIPRLMSNYIVYYTEEM